MLKSIAFALALALLCTPSRAFIVHSVGGATSIDIMQLSGTNVRFGSAAPYYVGTLTTNVSPPQPTFNNLPNAAYTIVASGGGCSGGDTVHFQIIGDGLYTSEVAANFSPGYKLCITASATGIPSFTTAFTITEGNKIDAAATYCAANGGGTGSSASPWHAACIQAAANAAVSGDTIFLAGGNWALSTADASGVTIGTGVTTGSALTINLVGVGSGNNFDVWGHISNPSGVDQCPTAGTTITCVYGTGASHVYPGVSYSGTIKYSGCVTGRIEHIFFDGSQTTAGGGIWGLLNIINCNNYTGGNQITINDVRHLAFKDNTISSQAQLYFTQYSNYTAQNSLFGDPLTPNGASYTNSQTAQFNGGGANVTMSNDVFYQGGFNPIYLSNVTFTGNQQYDYVDAVGGTAITPAMGDTGSGVGAQYAVYCPQAGATANGQCNGDVTFFATNNLFYAAGHYFGTGGGGNDPGTGGGVNDLHWTGNWLIGDAPQINACEIAPCQVTAVLATAASCTSGTITFTAANTGITGEFSALGFLPQGYNNIWQATTANSTTITVAGVTCPGTATQLGYLVQGQGSPMVINGAVDANCNESQNGTYGFSVTNNSLLGVSTARLDESGSVNFGTRCKLGNPFSGNYTAIPINTYGFNGQFNYLSSSSNQYLTNATTISPTQQNNFCTPAAGSVTGCATTGFNTAPTVSFKIGLLQVDSATGLKEVPINSPAFTAQYGAVQWLASTSVTPPLSSDTRWSSNNSFWSNAAPAAYPPSAANSWIPPVELSGVSHGQTVYLWVMDSVNHISVAASALIP